MPLDWDIKLDAVSINDEIVSFNIRESKGSYVRELTLFSADPDFYDQFVYTDLPTARIEVLTKIDVDWVSQGMFFIEKPVLVVNVDSTTSPGVWGRSETAKVGPPFAQKVSRYYNEDTTFLDIVNEMAALCGITVTSEINNYRILANTYVIDNIYPVDVITELAGYAAGYVTSSLSGDLIIKNDIFHPSSPAHTFTDVEIVDISENVDLPDFGNRIRVSALGGLGSGYSVRLEPLDDSDCLPADGESTGKFLAFVNNAENEPAADNTMVTWDIGYGATLAFPATATGDYLLSSKKHEATNFYTVSVDFPIKAVIGIWAYSDSGHRNNFWEEDYGSFNDQEITVRTPFAYCDQALRITYITSGCAINIVTAGEEARDIEITADVEGATDTSLLKLGNTCACGSSLNAKTNPSEAVCLGNLANLLIWATISKIPATGQRVEIRLTKGCGELSSENKILKNVSILNEASYAENVIAGVSQVSVEINISPAQLPQVFTKADTEKTNNLYLSFEGKILDLNTVLPTGTEVVVDYHAEGATLVAWRTLGATKDCDAEVTLTMADGTEAGLYNTVSLRARDCTIYNSPPDTNEDYSEYDPPYDDQGGGGDGGFPDDGNDWHVEDYIGPGGSHDPCLSTIMDRILNIDTATNDEERDAIRFGVKSSADCPEGGEFVCPCSELCTSEIMADGNILSESRTIHEIVSDTYEKGTPEYTEEFAAVMDANIASCSEDCEEHRLSLCGDCDTATGPAQLAPGESAEYVCSNGISKIITMPEDHCGVYSTNVGCCSVDIASTDGQWTDMPCDMCAVDLPTVYSASGEDYDMRYDYIDNKVFFQQWMHTGRSIYHRYDTGGEACSHVSEGSGFVGSVANMADRTPYWWGACGSLKGWEYWDGFVPMFSEGPNPGYSGVTYNYGTPIYREWTC